MQQISIAHGWPKYETNKWHTYGMKIHTSCLSTFSSKRFLFSVVIYQNCNYNDFIRRIKLKKPNRTQSFSLPNLSRNSILDANHLCPNLASVPLDPLQMISTL